MNLRKAVIKLAYENPKLRADLLPLVASRTSLPALPASAKAWQLYSDMPGVAKAAEELTKALQGTMPFLKVLLQPIKSYIGQDRVQSKLLNDVFNKEIAPVLSKWRKFGATDTEPRTIAKEWINKAATHLYGFDEYVDF